MRALFPSIPLKKIKQDSSRIAADMGDGWNFLRKFNIKPTDEERQFIKLNKNNGLKCCKRRMCESIHLIAVTCAANNTHLEDYNERFSLLIKIANDVDFYTGTESKERFFVAFQMYVEDWNNFKRAKDNDAYVVWANATFSDRWKQFMK